jgi:hypothetical protein
MSADEKKGRAILPEPNYLALKDFFCQYILVFFDIFCIISSYKKSEEVYFMILPNEICKITDRVAKALLPELRTDIRELNITQALDASCDFLDRLTRDDIFIVYQNAIKTGDRESFKVKMNLNHGAVELVSMDIGHFYGFLEREKSLLIESGFSQETAKLIIEKVQSSIDHLRRNQATHYELKSAISELRQYVCSKSILMSHSLGRKRPLRSFVYGLGGISLIVVNIAASGILSQIGVAASAGIGGALVKDAVVIILEEMTDKE